MSRWVAWLALAGLVTLLLRAAGLHLLWLFILYILN